MQRNPFFIDSDIRRAETLPSEFYERDDVFESLKQTVFGRTWHWVGLKQYLLPPTQSVYPFILLPDFIDEPLLLSRQKNNETLCLSNVCTHRGNILYEKPGRPKQLVCGYHGRRFNLDGSFRSMPEFEDVLDFPRPCDDLKKHSISAWHNHLFVAINPAFDLTNWFSVLNERIGFMPISQFQYQENSHVVYEIDAHWALYCDNYLEGFHIPFVHQSLNKTINYDLYKTILFDQGSVQIGYAKDDSDTFNLPEGHIDFGSNVAAYYFWLFPNLMLNFYPWGLSVNLVQPVTKNKTRVTFQSYIFNTQKQQQGAGADLNLVEEEDEAVVNAVQKGIRSTGYSTGRFSPTREQGVHKFHLMLSQFLNNDFTNL